MTGRSRKKMAQMFSEAAALPRCGDALVDWFFRQFVAILRSERVRIARKKRLINPDDPHRRVIRGLMDPDIHPSGSWVQILINPAKNTHRCRDEEVETLIHELSHVLMPRSGERAILAMESMLSKRFSLAQRRALKAFIPRHEVKRYPRMAVSRKIATA
ncbi:MAG: hypothetical protein IT406_03145 [Candidatus Yanofskybacteria bacterium]|nr:hypothetical protein [Candidatus Yanofskybacteria bacterium]